MKKIYLNGLSKIVTMKSTVRGGKPCFKNTRIPVDYVIKHLEKGWDLSEVKDLFPELNEGDIKKTYEHKSLFL